MQSYKCQAIEWIKKKLTVYDECVKGSNVPIRKEGAYILKKLMKLSITFLLSSKGLISKLGFTKAIFLFFFSFFHTVISHAASLSFNDFPETYELNTTSYRAAIWKNAGFTDEGIPIDVVGMVLYDSGNPGYSGLAFDINEDDILIMMKSSGAQTVNMRFYFVRSGTK